MTLCRTPLGDGCGNPRGTFATFEAIVRDYRSERSRRRAEAEWWRASDLDLDQAIDRAIKSMLPGSRGRLVRHGHQCRIPQQVLAEGSAALRATSKVIELAEDFRLLHAIVRSVLGGVSGAGPLLAYDVADRIGIHRGVRPDAIYLHAGTKAGAKALGIAVSGRDHLCVIELPPAFRILAAEEAEDVLCIYKKHFPRLLH